jgi:Bacterial low temperature requirement A protein (LtrA)
MIGTQDQVAVEEESPPMEAAELEEDYGYNQDEFPVNVGERHGDGLDAPQMKASRRGVVVTSTKRNASACPYDVSFRPSRALLYSPPRQRQKWGDAQVLPRVNWGDLFFDLFYVAATYNVSNLLVASPDKSGLLYAAGTFFPVMDIWHQKTYYDGRYVTEADLYHGLTNVVTLVILGVAILNIRPVAILADPSGHPRIFAFTLMLVLDKLSATTALAEVYFRGVGQPQIKSASLRELLGRLSTAPFYAAAMIFSAIHFFGDKSTTEGRVLATAAVEEQGSYPTGDTTNIPIILCLTGFLVGQAYTMINILFCIPGNGGHKEM